MITVIDYGLGNIGSIINAFNKIGINAVISCDPYEILRSDGLVFPGDGAAGQAMKNLTKEKLVDPIKYFISSGKPFLGICLGMQILLSLSEEGNIKCLGIIPGRVKKFNNGLKIPQIGWNQVKLINKNKKINNLFQNIPDKSYFYFINSFYCESNDKSIIAANTDYGNNFCSVIIKDNVTGVQFHPEKSGEKGIQFLKNYINNINY